MGPPLCSMSEHPGFAAPLLCSAARGARPFLEKKNNKVFGARGNFSFSKANYVILQPLKMLLCGEKSLMGE